jgi:predicted GIY-YIG superfamily endonuclease
VSDESGEPTALYRVFGEADLLLYIGISKDFGARWKQHARVQPWWDERRRLTVELLDSRSAAEAAEVAAIRAEGPKYNKRGTAQPDALIQLVQPPPAPPPVARPWTESWELVTGPLTYDEFMSMPVTVDLPAAARALGLGRSAAYELARTGEFPCPVMRIGQRYRVSVPVLVQAPDVRVRELRRLMIIPAKPAA